MGEEGGSGRCGSTVCVECKKREERERERWRGKLCFEVTRAVNERGQALHREEEEESKREQRARGKAIVGLLGDKKITIQRFFQKSAVWGNKSKAAACNKGSWKCEISLLYFTLLHCGKGIQTCRWTGALCGHIRAPTHTGIHTSYCSYIEGTFALVDLRVSFWFQHQNKAWLLISFGSSLHLKWTLVKKEICTLDNSDMSALCSQATLATKRMAFTIRQSQSWSEALLDNTTRGNYKYCRWLLLWASAMSAKCFSPFGTHREIQ